MTGAGRAAGSKPSAQNRVVGGKRGEVGTTSSGRYVRCHMSYYYGPCSPLFCASHMPSRPTPASAEDRHTASREPSSSSASSTSVAPHVSGSTSSHGGAAQQTRAGPTPRKGPTSQGAAVKDEQRRWADVAYSMGAETSTKSGAQGKEAVGVSELHRDFRF